jgi:archaetidylinositol phosphate synthase
LIQRLINLFMAVKLKQVGIYSRSEMVFMKWLQGIKKVIFPEWFLKILVRFGITPDLVSLFSLMVVLASFVGAFLLEDPLYFVVGIWLHMFIDGLDGTLARYKNVSSLRGTFVDAIVDFVGIVATSIVIIVFNFAEPISVLIYTVAYAFVLIISYVLALQKKCYPFVYRPRIVVYATMLLDIIFDRNFTEYAIYFLAGLLLLFQLQGLYLVYREIRN